MMISRLSFRLRPLLIFAAAATMLTSSCTSLLTGTVIKPAVGNLQKQRDVELVCEGAPAYLLMIDSLIESDPDSKELLLLGSQSYSGSVAALASCGSSKERLQTLSEKARSYGQRLLEELLATGLSPDNPSLDQQLQNLDTGAAPYLFWGTFGWLSWITHQQGSPAAMADLVLIEKLMSHLLELDETVENGSVHLFFGALHGSKPAMIGGDPVKSRFHFERALEISERSFLLVQTTFAETYCRMTFNKELHDALLEEVLAFPLESAPETILTNQIAKRKARLLLAEDFFAE